MLSFGLRLFSVGTRNELMNAALNVFDPQAGHLRSAVSLHSGLLAALN
jgi:hypothetical protein